MCHVPDPQATSHFSGPLLNIRTTAPSQESLPKGSWDVGLRIDTAGHIDTVPAQPMARSAPDTYAPPRTTTETAIGQRSADVLKVWSKLLLQCTNDFSVCLSVCPSHHIFPAFSEGRIGVSSYTGKGGEGCHLGGIFFTCVQSTAIQYLQGVLLVTE